MKLSVWAELQGISYKTAWRMWKAGQLPVPAEQMATGTVIVHAESRAQGVALYARVSSTDQEADLDRQLSRLTEYAIAQKLVVVDAVRKLGRDSTETVKACSGCFAIPKCRLFWLSIESG